MGGEVRMGPGSRAAMAGPEESDPWPDVSGPGPCVGAPAWRAGETSV